MLDDARFGCPTNVESERRLDTKPSSLLSVRIAGFRRLVRFLQIPSRFIERALSIVVGLDRLPVLIRRALPLPGKVEYLAELNVAPNFRPTRLAVAIQAIAV